MRRRLVPHLKKARSENKKCMMVFDHLIIDGKKFALDDGDNWKEMRQDCGRADRGGGQRLLLSLAGAATSKMLFKTTKVFPIAKFPRKKSCLHLES